jgi:hypothetical protein
MKPEDIKLGDSFWCIRASMEADNFTGYGDAGPEWPWSGVITGLGTTHFSLSKLQENGTPDEDSNATALCRFDELFKIREEAAEYRRRAKDVKTNLKEPRYKPESTDEICIGARAETQQ